MGNQQIGPWLSPDRLSEATIVNDPDITEEIIVWAEVGDGKS